MRDQKNRTAMTDYLTDSCNESSNNHSFLSSMSVPNPSNLMLKILKTIKMSKTMKIGLVAGFSCALNHPM